MGYNINLTDVHISCLLMFGECNAIYITTNIASGEQPNGHLNKFQYFVSSLMYYFSLYTSNHLPLKCFSN